MTFLSSLKHNGTTPTPTNKLPRIVDNKSPGRSPVVTNINARINSNIHSSRRSNEGFVISHGRALNLLSLENIRGFTDDTTRIPSIRLICTLCNVIEGQIDLSRSGIQIPLVADTIVRNLDELDGPQLERFVRDMKERSLDMEELIRQSPPSDFKLVFGILLPTFVRVKHDQPAYRAIVNVILFFGQAFYKVFEDKAWTNISESEEWEFVVSSFSFPSVKAPQLDPATKKLSDFVLIAKVFFGWENKAVSDSSTNSTQILNENKQVQFLANMKIRISQPSFTYILAAFIEIEPNLSHPLALYVLTLTRTNILGCDLNIPQGWACMATSLHILTFLIRQGVEGDVCEMITEVRRWVMRDGVPGCLLKAWCRLVNTLLELKSAEVWVSMAAEVCKHVGGDGLITALVIFAPMLKLRKTLCASFFQGLLNLATQSRLKLLGLVIVIEDEDFEMGKSRKFRVNWDLPVLKSSEYSKISTCWNASGIGMAIAQHVSATSTSISRPALEVLAACSRHVFQASPGELNVWRKVWRHLKNYVFVAMIDNDRDHSRMANEVASNFLKGGILNETVFSTH